MTTAMRNDFLIPTLDIPKEASTGDHLYTVVECYNTSLKLLAFISQSDLQRNGPEDFTITLRLDDTVENRSAMHFRDAWRQFLLLNNLFQFLPNFLPVTTEQIQEFGPQEELLLEEIADAKVVDEIWAEAFTFADEECVDLLQACQNAALPPPMIGFELLDPSGKIIGQAELAWEGRQVAVFIPDQEADREAFLKSNWQFYAPSDIAELLSELS
jgi:hypothetical protein